MYIHTYSCIDAYTHTYMNTDEYLYARRLYRKKKIGSSFNTHPNILFHYIQCCIRIEMIMSNVTFVKDLKLLVIITYTKTIITTYVKL